MDCKPCHDRGQDTAAIRLDVTVVRGVCSDDVSILLNGKKLDEDNDASVRYIEETVDKIPGKLKWLLTCKIFQLGERLAGSKGTGTGMLRRCLESLSDSGPVKEAAKCNYEKCQAEGAEKERIALAREKAEAMEKAAIEAEKKA